MASPVSTSAAQPAVQTVHVLQQIPAALSSALLAQPATIIAKSGEPQENGEHSEIKGQQSQTGLSARLPLPCDGADSVLLAVKVETIPTITSIGGSSRIIQSVTSAAPLQTVTIVQAAPVGQHQLPIKAIMQNGTHSATAAGERHSHPLFSLTTRAQSTLEVQIVQDCLTTFGHWEAPMLPRCSSSWKKDVKSAKTSHIYFF